jgi:hypothetical protein
MRPGHSVGWPQAAGMDDGLANERKMQGREKERGRVCEGAGIRLTSAVAMPLAGPGEGEGWG